MFNVVCLTVCVEGTKNVLVLELSFLKEKIESEGKIQEYRINSLYTKWQNGDSKFAERR